MFLRKDTPTALDPAAVDIESFEEGLHDLLVMIGLPTESRTHAAVRKMMVDDLLWYLDNSKPGDLEV